MGIAGISFLLMWASVPVFRIVVRDGAELYATNRRLKHDNRRLQHEALGQRQAIVRLGEEAQTAEARLKTTANDLAEARQAVTHATSELGRAQTARDQAQAVRQDALRKLAAARQSVAGAQRTLAAAERDLTHTRNRLGATSAQLAQKRAAIASAAHRLHRLRQEKQRAERIARAETRKVADANRTFQEVTRYLQERRRAQQAEFAREQTRQAQLAAEIRALEERRDTLGRVLDASLRSTFDLRQRRITYGVGEEVERAGLPGGLNLAEAQRELWRLLARAADRASARGARAASSDGRAVVIPPKRFAGGSGGAVTGAANATSVRTADEADSVAAAAEAIANQNENVAVLVVAAANAVEGEPVPVELRTFRNKRVLRQNAVVGRFALDGSRPQSEVADALYAFLRRDVRRKLLDSGVIPPSPDLGSGSDGNAGGASAAAATATTEGENVVRLAGGQWLQLLDEVQQAGPNAQVVVRAASDLRAADPVALRFEVIPGAVSSSGGTGITAPLSRGGGAAALRR
jgi:hypothetical protein